MAAHIETTEVETGVLLANSASDEGERQETKRVGGSKRVVVVVLGGGLALALLGVAFAVRSRRSVPSQRGAPFGTRSHLDHDVVSLQGFPTAFPGVATAIPAIPATATLPPVAATVAPDVCALHPQLPIAATSAVTRTEENLADGNPCRDSEEEFEGECYRKCECLLAPGTVVPGAMRKSAFACCDPRTVGNCADSENPMDWTTPSILPCQGFAISSANDGTACPHEEGACLEDEEQNMQMCFKKCSLLTVTPAFPAGEFPVRATAFTCVKAECAAVTDAVVNPDCNPLLMGAGTSTDAKYNVGGGCGDGDGGKMTPCKPHYPLKDETEAAPPR